MYSKLHSLFHNNQTYTNLKFLIAGSYELKKNNVPSEPGKGKMEGQLEKTQNSGTVHN